MKAKIILSVLLTSAALLGVAAVEQQSGWPLAKLTVHVVGEQGQPIPGAKVQVWFSEQSSNRQSTIKGETDVQGEFAAEGHSDMRLLSDASKAGFYDSGSSGTIFKNQENGRWVPWNPVAEIILRPIGQPVALYAKTGWFDIPVVDQPCGYDLVKGDWVAPFGKGIVADLVFKLERRYESRDDFEVKAEVRFSQPLDGIQEVELPAIGRNSVFKWPREAPETGYGPILTTHFAHKPGANFEITASEEQAYFFRVRTIEQNGQIVSALYGKIKGGLQLAASNSKTSKIKLTYYLNPTSLDRNLEWDPKHNLLPRLNPDEAPREP